MKKFNLLLVLISLLAFGVRVWMLNTVPTGFDSDSIDVGYVGKFLIINGRDPAGNVLPLYFNKFGDFRPTGLFYLSGIMQFVAGSSVFNVRLATALFGSLSVFVVFMFTYELFKRREIAYFSSFFLAVLPWDIVLSRDAHEALVGYFFTIAGFYFLLKFASDVKRRKYLLWGAGLLLFSYLFYHGVRTLTPLLLLVFWLFYRNRDLAKVVVLFFALTFAIIISPYGGGRLGQIVFYKSAGAMQKLQELPYADSSVKEARIFHNKVVVYSRDVVSTWIEHFSPSFLLLKGGYPERYMVPETGLAYFTLVFALLAGVIYVAKKPRETGLIIAWLLVSPVQAALTYEDIPSVTRASFMIFPVVILGGVGLWWILTLFKKRLWRNAFMIAFFSVMLLEIIYFMHQYLVHQKGNKGLLRNEGNIEISHYIISQKDKYDLVLAPFEDNLPFYFLFFGNHFDRSIKIDIADNSTGFQYQNVQYLRNNCPSHLSDQYVGRKILYIDAPNCEKRPDVGEIYKVTRTDLTDAWVVRVVK
jgi:hypothetical protein